MSIDTNDDFSRSPVDNFNLKPWWYLLVIEMGVMISIPIFVFGGQLGRGLSFSDLVLACFAGAAILGVIGGLTARLGAVLRCSTALIAKLTFGARGSSIVSLCLVLAMTGWWAVQTEMFALAVVQLAKQLFGIELSIGLLIAAGGAAMITTAALGIRAIGRLSYVAVPLLIGGLCYALSAVLLPANLQSVLSFHPQSASALTFGAAAAMVAGGFIVGAAMNPDYSRFARDTRHALAYSVTDYAFVYPSLLIACGMIAIYFQTNDIMIHLMPASFSWVVFVMMMLATWAANDCNLYSSSLSLAAILPKCPRPLLAVVAGVVGIVFAELHLVQHMVSFLTLLGILIAPISGVFVVNFWGRTRAVETSELHQLPAWKFGPLLAWVFGATIGYVATPMASLGLGLLTITTVPTLDSVLGATLFMLAVRALKARAVDSKLDACVVVAERAGGALGA